MCVRASTGWIGSSLSVKIMETWCWTWLSRSVWYSHPFFEGYACMHACIHPIMLLLTLLFWKQSRPTITASSKACGGGCPELPERDNPSLFGADSRCPLFGPYVPYVAFLVAMGRIKSIYHNEKCKMNESFAPAAIMKHKYK